MLVCSVQIISLLDSQSKFQTLTLLSSMTMLFEFNPDDTRGDVGAKTTSHVLAFHFVRWLIIHGTRESKIYGEVEVLFDSRNSCTRRDTHNFLPEYIKCKGSSRFFPFLFHTYFSYQV